MVVMKVEIVVMVAVVSASKSLPRNLHFDVKPLHASQ